MCAAVPTPWYKIHSPEIGQAYEQFSHACKEKGVLDRKTKELLMLALANVFRCPHCTENHIQAAIEAGATKEEITEALLISAYEAAGTQLSWNADLFRKFLGKIAD